LNKVLLSAHVAMAIIFIGPITVAASLFPRFARDALRNSGPGSGGAAAVLHRITRVYAVLAMAVPALGVVLAARMGVLTDAWVLLSLVATAGAGVVLGALVLPGQRVLMAGIAAGNAMSAANEDPRLRRSGRRISMFTGIFSMLWLVVVVLMIVRPGSTTGV
jgi:hypothetical protein